MVHLEAALTFCHSNLVDDENLIARTWFMDSRLSDNGSQNDGDHYCAISLLAKPSRIDSETLRNDGPGKANATALSEELTGSIEGPINRDVECIS